MAALPQVLVVADDAAFARSLEILLEEEGGCTVRSVRTASDALACLRASSPPRLLIGDLDIGPSHAADLARQVRRVHPGVAVVLLTAHHPELLRAEGDLGDSARVLAKPLDPEALLDLVVRLTAADVP